VATNGKLNAPVGLITADEVALAGGKYSTANSLYYLYIGQNYWTMSPAYFSSNAYGTYVYSTGYLAAVGITITRGVRPVISIVPEALTLGTGTMTDPFRISA